MNTTAQESVEFTLNKTDHIELSPHSTYLISSIPNHLKVMLSPQYTLIDTVVVNGLYEPWKDGLVITPMDEEVTVYLTAQDMQGEESSFKRTFKTLPPPELRVGKIDCDSTGNIWDLLMDGELHVRPEIYGLTISGFDIEFVVDRELVLLTSQSNQFTREMRKSLMNVSDGTLLQFTNIQLGGLSVESTLPGCQIYITEDSPPIRYKTGGDRVIQK